MNSHETYTSDTFVGNDQEWQNENRRQKYTKLAEYENTFIHEHSEHQWWSFFDNGVEDENGTIWSVYNRWCDETQTNGWKVICCPHGHDEFREIPISQVDRQQVYPAKAGKDGLTTFQLWIRDETIGLRNNDALNVLLYHNDFEVKPTLHLWNQAHTMTPVILPELVQLAHESHLEAAAD